MTTPTAGALANPYVGPRTFTAADRQRFFGREAEAANLLARVVSERLLLFYAQSGAGKSSLINARLIPQLREEERFSMLPVGRVAGALPSGVDQAENIFLFNLMASLDAGGGDPARWAHLGLNAFLEHLVTDDGLAWRYDPAAASEPAAKEVAPVVDTGSAPRFALIIDQFEEIITGHPDRWREREGFFRQLDAVLRANPNLWVVLSLREDHVAALDPYAALLFNRLRARFYMERMGGEAALDAIRRPAELYHRPFAAEVAESLCERLRQEHVPGQKTTVTGQYVEPVQLQVVCYQLWEKLKERPLGPITADDLNEAGNVEGALAEYYDQVIRDVLKAAGIQVSEGQVRDWFGKELITAAGTRGFVPEIGEQTGGVPKKVANFLENRFLIRRDPRAGGVWYELTHDTFIKPILASNEAWHAAQRLPEIVSFSISPTVVSPGIAATVCWQVQNAESVWLEPGQGPRKDLQGATEIEPASTTAYMLNAQRSAGPVVTSRPLTVIVAKDDLKTTRYELSRSMRGRRFNVLVGPEVDRELLPFSTAIAAEEWAAEALTGRGQPLWDRYLHFMKERLSEEVATPPQDDSQITAGNLHSTTVSELARRLGYLGRHPERRKLMDALVALPASLYITTSYHTLLEEALRMAGREAQTGVCDWLPGAGDALLAPFNYEPGYEPSAEQPAVFHLYGLDVSPQSLALTEDDYVTFLMQVREDRERVPLFVRYALYSHLNLLAGFDPQAWSFKALYHGLITWNSKRRRLMGRPAGLLQIDSPVERAEAEVRFLEASFAKHGLKLFWGRAERFLRWVAMANQETEDTVRNRAEVDRYLGLGAWAEEEKP